MFCPICSSPLTDDSVACSVCGHQISQSAPAQSAHSQSAHTPNMPKGTARDKKAGLLVLVTFLLTLALLAVSIYLPLSTDIFEIPAVSTLMDVVGAKGDVREMKDELENGLDELSAEFDKLEETYEELEAEMSSQEQKAAKKAIKGADKIVKKAEDVADEMSLLNFRSFVGSFSEVADDLDDLDGFEGFGEVEESFEQVEGIVNIVIIAVIAMFAFPAIFTLLAGLLKSKGLTITALVFMVLSQLALCGVLWVVLSLVVYIAQAILCDKAKKAKANAFLG